MNYFNHTFRLKLAIILFAFLLVLMFLKVTNNLVESFSKEERKKVELWAKGIKQLSNPIPADEDDFTFISEVILNNYTIPVILTDTSDKIISVKNLDTLNHKEGYAKKVLQQMKKGHKPIKITIFPGELNYVYYKDSVLLTRLSYYPLVQLAIIVVFFVFSYLIFNSIRNEEQNKVWVGLSKETAHQLGTPTSSLMAWLEILKEKQIDPLLTNELEKDVQRLEKITARFSKIGSVPELKNENLVDLVHESVEYLKKRISDQAIISIFTSNDDLNTPLNKSLFEWVIENILKNAVDAINGFGNIDIKITDNIQVVFIDVYDSGKGINKNQFKEIFKPGFTTKSRGWGLGLSLSKRIIEHYHGGKIFVKESELNKGTCFRIVLKKNPKINF